jgi:hypothetical protein
MVNANLTAKASDWRRLPWGDGLALLAWLLATRILGGSVFSLWLILLAIFVGLLTAVSLAASFLGEAAAAKMAPAMKLLTVLTHLVITGFIALLLSVAYLAMQYDWRH